MDTVNRILFLTAAVIALAGLVVAVRFLYLAWSDYRFGKERRQGADRRRRDMAVPIERRKGDRRS